jgi:hypothetical protein
MSIYKSLIPKRLFCLVLLIIGPAIEKGSSLNVDNKCNQHRINSLIVNDDAVTYSFTYITDGNGNNIGAHYYLYNHSNAPVNVHWYFDGYYNVTSSGGFEGNEYIIVNGFVLITTFNQVDASSAWSGGTIHYNWQ